MRRYWLVKSEPDEFSIDDLAKEPGGRAFWDGVRNHQSKLHLRDGMKPGDGVLFWHSSCDAIGVAGEAVVSAEARPDPTQFDKNGGRFEPRATKDKPVWWGSEIKFVRKCGEVLSPERLRKVAALHNMMVLRRGARLSVQPVTEGEWKAIRKLPEWG